MGWSAIVYVKKSIRWCLEKSVQFEDTWAWSTRKYWNFTTWRFLRRYRFLSVKSWKPWWKDAQIRNFDYKTLTPGMGELNLEPWSRVDRDQEVLKEEKVSVTSGKKKVSVRKETSAVSSMKPKIATGEACFGFILSFSCFIFVCFEHSAFATPITNTMSWRKKRPVFAWRPMQFLPRTPRSCAKARTHCRLAFWANRITRSKCVEEEKYPRQK